MTGRTHDLIAITALGAVVFIEAPRTYSLATAVICVVANQIGGIAPDIDQPTAPLWRNLPVGSFFGKIFDKLLGGHRFLTHSILGLILFGAAAKALLVFLQPLAPHLATSLVWWSFMIGMVSHLLADTVTKEGVPWLLPIPIKFGFPPLKKLRMTTGKKLETLVVFPGILAVDVWFCIIHHSWLLNLLHHRIV